MQGHKVLIIPEGDARRLLNWQARLFALLLFGVCSTPSAEVERLLRSPDPVAFAEAGDQAGWSVSVHGEWAIVGAPTGSSGPSSFGKAFVYRQGSSPGSWTFNSQLLSPFPGPGDRFGETVSVFDDRILVSGRIGPSDLSAVYLFELDADEWAHTDTFEPQVASEGRLGTDIAQSQNTIAIGAASDREPTLGRGTVWMFERSGSAWQLAEKVYPNDPNAGGFGFSVALEEDRLLVGNPGYSDTFIQQGAAFIFDRSGSTWTLTDLLVASNPGWSKKLGWDVDLDSDRALVGMLSWDTDDNTNLSARLFEFNQTEWTETVQITPSETLQPHSAYATAVEIMGDSVFIGDQNWDGALTDQGRVHVFHYQNGIWEEDAPLSESNIAGRPGLYGFSIAASGESIIVGTPRSDYIDLGAGSATVFQFQHQQPIAETRLTPSDSEKDDEFGHGLASTAQTLLVGAPGDSSRGQKSGSVLVFQKALGEWKQTAILSPQTLELYDRFGTAVAVEDSIAVIGAHSSDAIDDRAGAAYVFESNGATWQERQMLLPLDGLEQDYFGSAVDIYGDRIIIGAPGFFIPGIGISNPGQGYIFAKIGDQWEQAASLIPSDSSCCQLFAYDVQINGNFAFFSAPTEGPTNDYDGAVYVFRLDGSEWVEYQKILPPAGDTAGRFGLSIALRGDQLLIGAPSISGAFAEEGKAYLYRWDGSAWVLDQELFAPSPADQNWFGRQVDFVDGKIAIAANVPTGQDTDFGVTHLFLQDGSAWSAKAEYPFPEPLDDETQIRDLAFAGTHLFTGMPFRDEEYADSGAVFFVDTNLIFADEFEIE